MLIPFGEAFLTSSKSLVISSFLVISAAILMSALQPDPHYTSTHGIISPRSWPSPPNFFATSLSLSAFREVTKTLAPFSTSASVCISPIPVPPPVMSEKAHIRTSNRAPRDIPVTTAVSPLQLNSSEAFRCLCSPVWLLILGMVVLSGRLGIKTGRNAEAVRDGVCRRQAEMNGLIVLADMMGRRLSAS